MSLGYSFINDGRSDFLVDGGVMMTRLVPEGRGVSMNFVNEQLLDS